MTALKSSPARISLDPTHDDRIMLVAVSDDLTSCVLRFTSGQAARLGHRLIEMAEQVERQSRELELP